MLDIKFIRDNKDIVAAGAKKKHVDIDLDALIALDDSRKELLQTVEEKRAQQNEVTKTIASERDSDKRQKMIEQMQTLKADMQKEEDALKEVMDKWRSLMLQVPNVPDMSVPDGATDEDNVEIRTWGDKPQFGFEPKDHIDILTALDMVDFERGSKVHGFRGYFLKNEGVELSFAMWNYARDFFMKKGLDLMMPPTIVRKENFYGTGHLPNEAEDLYKTQDDEFLTGTAEVPVMGYYRDEEIDFSKLPIKLLAFSPCFRREAGSHGKDTKGLIRVHEFFKWEQVILSEASHEKTVELHEWLTQNTEEFMQSLGIPYHVVVNCGGDLGQGQVKKYDIEAWVPKESKYRETHSSSYFHDFQTRRFNITYRDREGKKRFAHSLNNTAVAGPRILVSLVENYQQADGSIQIPEVLRPYLGGREVIVKK
ncbi:serine--tRNA ligase [Candidatus Kaiserbacteria bacterium]|nr:MAG: serine--tRNA ligase [Candidatus Kaiserbacteria bacterium]